MINIKKSHPIYSPPSFIRIKRSSLVIVPAFNEEKSIHHVVLDIKNCAPFADILVINDGSSDNTATIARKSGAAVLNLPHNLGIGGAVRAGLAFAEEMGYSFILRMDGDGQHKAEDITRLLEPVEKGLVDAAFGSRFCGGSNAYCPPLIRRLGISTYSLIVSIIIGQKISDATSGLWCLNRKTIRYFSRYFPQDYPEVESHILLYKAGFSQMEVPVNMRARLAGRSSISPWRSVYYAFKVLLAAVIRAIQDAPELSEEEAYAT